MIRLWSRQSAGGDGGGGSPSSQPASSRHRSSPASPARHRFRDVGFHEVGEPPVQNTTCWVGAAVLWGGHAPSSLGTSPRVGPEVGKGSAGVG